MHLSDLNPTPATPCRVSIWDGFGWRLRRKPPHAGQPRQQTCESTANLWRSGRWLRAHGSFLYAIWGWRKRWGWRWVVGVKVYVKNVRCCLVAGGFVRHPVRKEEYS